MNNLCSNYKMFCKSCNTKTLLYDKKYHIIACRICGLVHENIDRKIILL